MKGLTPNIFVKDIAASLKFYEILGFTVTMKVPEQEPFVWVMMTNGNVNMMIQSFESLGNDLPEVERGRSGGALLFYIAVQGIRSFFEEIKGKVSVIKGLEKTFYGATEFTIQDPDGFLLTFAEDE